MILRGHARQPDGQVQPIRALDEIGALYQTPGVSFWLDLEAPEESALRQLGAHLKLSDDSIEDCLTGEQRPRVDEFEDHLFIVVYGILGPEDPEANEPRKVAIFFSDRFMITIHRESVASVNTLVNRFDRNAAQAMARGLDFLLFALLDRIVDNYLIVSDRLEDEVEKLEDRSLEADVDETIIADSAELRNDLIDLRRLAVSQRELLIPLANGEYDDISESLGQQFGHIRDHVTKVIETIDSLRERLQYVRDNYHAAIATRTNEVIKTLTLFATIILPLSLVAGIYGMNLNTWPGQRHPYGFWLVLTGMGVLGGGLFAYFRRKSWL